uniref:NADH-ubiquinone oxidoreductase chain 6 n=1 Tax=Dactylellina haptotyla TaxID=430498 RepID=A0A481ZKW3_9PEZI|nr:NADH dehydrogenase subunit 6 [Dactylellina haptotyla]QBL01979.1 NADH dehydrogenase subunit 6 [Dactylellina haptotyla]
MLYAIYSEIYTNGYSIIWLSIISVISIILGIFVIIARNPIIAVLYLILLFLVISGYLLLIGMSFIGLSYILVYISAVSILFLFTLMLINIRISELHSDNYNSLFLGLIVSAIIYSTITLNLNFTIKDSSWYKSVFHSSYDKWDSNMGALNEMTAIGTKWLRKSLLCL